MRYGSSTIGEGPKIVEPVTLVFPSRERMDQKEYPGTVIGRNAVLTNDRYPPTGNPELKGPLVEDNVMIGALPQFITCAPRRFTLLTNPLVKCRIA